MADLKIKEILGKATWINIHTLSKNSPDSSLEVRDDGGYGARWDTNYCFKGLLEPQLELNAKKTGD